MTPTDPKVDAYLAGLTQWRAELEALRAILLEAGLGEAFKWNSPCYTAGGGNVATLWSKKDHAALALFKGVLLADPEGLLVAPGDNSRSMRYVPFTSVAEIEARSGALKALVTEAAKNEAAGRKVEMPKDDLDYPEELTDRLDGDSEFRAAFEALTPGRRRGWVLHFSQPKQAATRNARIDRSAERILEGKGMHDR